MLDTANLDRMLVLLHVHRHRMKVVDLEALMRYRMLMLDLVIVMRVGRRRLVMLILHVQCWRFVVAAAIRWLEFVLLLGRLVVVKLMHLGAAVFDHAAQRDGTSAQRDGYLLGFIGFMRV